ncbi:MAG: ATP-grasp domain-containing protein [Acidimicrobiia bacterium]|nr:ATP-grasp domain-containing protein [Acidimicrobiia bacterium]
MPTVALVLPSSSYRGPDFVAAADELGVDLVIATDGSLPVASGRILAVVSVDFTDVAKAAEHIVRAGDMTPLEAVVGVDDQGVVVAALAAEALGLPHNTPSAVAATRDKAEMRRLLEAAGVPGARHGVATSVEEAVVVAADLGYPVVIKPRTLSASRGVIRVDDVGEVAIAFDRVAAIVAEAGESLPLLVEEYLPGDEVAVEGIATAGGVEILAVFDKPDPLTGPFFEETIYVTPSRHDPAVLADVERIVTAGVGAIGLAHGSVHAEVRITTDGVRLLEVAARSIGGLCSRSLRFGMLEQSLEVVLLRAALGMNRRGMGREERASGAMMLPIPRDGILREIRGQAAIDEVPGITGLQITVAPGKRIRPLPEGDRYLGFLFASAETPEEVEAALREGQALLEVVVE